MQQYILWNSSKVSKSTTGRVRREPRELHGVRERGDGALGGAPHVHEQERAGRLLCRRVF